MAPQTFLDLPEATKLKIYDLCGLIRPCPIDLTPPRPSSVELQLRRERGAVFGTLCYVPMAKSRSLITHTNYLDCSCPGIPIQLFLVSKAIYKDAYAIFYGRNKFVLRAHNAAHLNPLESLTPQAISTMNFLLIRLNCWPCPWGHDDVYLHDGCQVCSTPVADSDPILRLDSQAGQEIATTWRRLCLKLSTHIIPGQSNFVFICDIELYEDAEQIIAPLKLFPRLKKCTIRLGRPDLSLPNALSLRSIARDVSLKMTGEFIPQKKFSWEKLPRELRLQILNYTHLGAFGNHLPKFSPIRILDNKLHGDYFIAKCCKRCTFTFADCCCPTIHASYSASCQCRLLPLELFTVSKQMYTDASEILYSKNSFAFRGDPLGPITFFESLPTGAVGLIRYVEFAFDEDDILEWEERGLPEKWSKFVEYIKSNMNVPQLSLTIDLTDAIEIIRLNEDEDNAGTEEEDLWAKFVYDIYWEVACTLSTLEGLADVWFELAYWMGLKPLLEQKVMGKRWGEMAVLRDRRKDHEQKKDGYFKPLWTIPRWHHRFYKEAARLE